MKKEAVLITAAVLTALLFYACSSPMSVGEAGATGSFTITVGDESGRATLPWDGNIQIEDLDLTIKLYNGPGPAQTREGVRANQTVNFTVAVGRWEVSVEAYEAGVLKAEGSTVMNVKPGPNDTVKVTMKQPGTDSGSKPGGDDGSDGGDDGESGGEPEDGTWQYPFKVFDAATLKKVGTGTDGWGLDKYYKVTENIILSGDWTPIGDSDYPFTGNFDGNSMTISNLTISAPGNTEPLGLFGSVWGLVKNVNLANINISGGDLIGGVTGELKDGGRVENCSVSGSNIIGSGDYVGGIAGFIDDTSSVVKNCYTTGDVIGNDYVGGVVGYNNGMVENCYATGNVEGTTTVDNTGVVGGVVGYNNGMVENCYATGNISGFDATGGVVGGNFATVENCYATGNVTGNDNVGGVVGLNSNNSTVRNCAALGGKLTYHTETISGTEIFIAGRVVGQNLAGSTALQNNYGNSTMKDKTDTIITPSPTGALNNKDGADVSGGAGSGQFNNEYWWTDSTRWSTSNAWNFSATGPWQWDTGRQLPGLQNMP